MIDDPCEPLFLPCDARNASPSLYANLRRQLTHPIRRYRALAATQTRASSNETELSNEPDPAHNPGQLRITVHRYTVVRSDCR